MSNPIPRSKIPWAALLSIVVGGCTELIGPDSPQYELACVFYAGEGQAFEIPIDVLRRCESVEVRVVSFDAGVVYSYVVKGEA